MDPGKGNVIGMTKVPDFEQRQSVPVEGEDQDRLDLPPPYEATASTPASTTAPAVTPPGSSSPAGSVRGEDAAFLPQERGYQRTCPMSVGGSKDEESHCGGHETAMVGVPSHGADGAGDQARQLDSFIRSMNIFGIQVTRKLSILSHYEVSS
ncbi:hypothetical protein CGMCC3_g13360 [Colletotrichum fructicola]|nr:uncharacterized protein CGMCC3_g13360 [Colletotrichum fructicola]KAE9570604.1 hypothetical protein CGMCC3_g13360 [Colletotrichum fructicola]KAF5483183.1 hypothetical protein CGCF413_v014398 [Colletotrichum fructicola]